MYTTRSRTKADNVARKSKTGGAIFMDRDGCYMVAFNKEQFDFCVKMDWQHLGGYFATKLDK